MVRLIYRLQYTMTSSEDQSGFL